MGSNEFSQQGRDAITASEKPVILFVGESHQRTISLPSLLLQEGFTVHAARTEDEALRTAAQTEVHVVVFGDSFDLQNRARLADCILQLRPKPRVVMLYQSSISQAEQADAVLNVAADPKDLIRTIQYLLTGKC